MEKHKEIVIKNAVREGIKSALAEVRDVGMDLVCYPMQQLFEFCPHNLLIGSKRLCVLNLPQDTLDSHFRCHLFQK